MAEFVKEDASEQSEESVHLLLNSLHQLAATAKFEEYFNLFHREGKFLGTDGTENWTTEEFKEWSKPYFVGEDCAWEYIPVPGQRQITIVRQPSSAHNTEPTYATFDELLYCCDLKCHTRGSGTLVHEDGRWQLMMYHITFPIPDGANETVMDRLINGKRILRQKAVNQAMEDSAAEAARQLLEDMELDGGLGLGLGSKKNKSNTKSTKKKK